MIFILIIQSFDSVMAVPLMATFILVLDYLVFQRKLLRKGDFWIVWGDVCVNFVFIFLPYIATLLSTADVL